MKQSDVLFVINPKSGTSKKKKIIKYLRKHNLNYVLTEYAGHAEILARECVERVVVAVGGDGTVNEVARGIGSSDKVLGIVPCGSGDGLALCLRISRNYKQAIKTIFAGIVSQIDTAQINDKPFYSVCGVGFDAYVSREFAMSRKRGIAKYIEIGLRSLIKYKRDRYLVTIYEDTIELDAVSVTIGNSNQWGNGAKITPRASLTDGKLDITIMEKLTFFQLPYAAFLLMTGQLSRYKYVRSFIGEHVRIYRSEGGLAHADGDCFFTDQHIDVSICKHSLNVIVPSC